MVTQETLDLLFMVRIHAPEISAPEALKSEQMSSRSVEQEKAHLRSPDLMLN